MRNANIKLIFTAITILIISNLPISTYAQSKVKNQELIAQINRELWIDSVKNTMSVEEKIGQLFMIRAHSDKTREYHQMVKTQIEQYKVGGVCFFQGGPERQISLINEYNITTKVPLLVAIDGEWGIGMRLDSAINFPKQMTLGATSDTTLLYEIGKAMGQQCRAVGVNVNFAPVVDVNSNPSNPVINIRSFGENPTSTGEMAWQIAKGLQDMGVMACAKHFPGHGDTYSDSHKTLPTVDNDFQTIDSIHLAPFKLLINKGVQSVMVGHLYIPSLDSSTNLASSLSSKIVNDLLFKSLDFKGLAITDALEMKGVSNYFRPGEIELMALQAGIDILLMPNDLDKSISYIKTALDSGIIDIYLIDSKLDKILKAKYDLGLQSQKTEKQIVHKENINNARFTSLVNEAYKKSLTLIENKEAILPLIPFGDDSIAVISIEYKEKTNFFGEIRKNYCNAATYSISKNATTKEFDELFEKTKNYNKIIINIMGTNILAKSNYGITKNSIDLVKKLSNTTNTILVISANPYGASQFIGESDLKAILIAYEDNPMTHAACANALFGIESISGKLPVTISKSYPSGFGIETEKNRLNFENSNETTYKTLNFNEIDSIVNDGIANQAYPGARVLIAKDGNVVYNKAYGTKTYSKLDSVELTTVYDLASITKVMATTLAIMHLDSEGKIDIQKKLGDYLTDLDGTNKEKLIIEDILRHQAGLQAWIPFYNKLLIDGQLDTNFISKTKKSGFNMQLSNSYYIADNYKEVIYQKIVNSEINHKKTYLYSDLGMYLLQRVIEEITGVGLDYYCDSIFFKPLGLKNTGFKPLERLDINQIAPTEDDQIFRKELIQGFVHDQGAAMLGGVAGHAGLFSTADELAVLCQLLLQDGSYGGKQYIKPEIVREYTNPNKNFEKNRRGLGFDKPLPNHKSGGPTCTEVSPLSFGHSGFTGTLFWVDPKYNLIYIFLSNRVHPSAENRKLINMSTRVKIQKEIYKQFKIVD